jgi:hypothetical protein
MANEMRTFVKVLSNKKQVSNKEVVYSDNFSHSFHTLPKESLKGSTLI